MLTRENLIDFLSPFFFRLLAVLLWNLISPQTPSTTTDDLIYHLGNHTLVSATMPTSTYVKCPWTCELTNDAGYVVYSALGSFYIPMLVMLFFYWRIYRAAIRTTRAINQGFRTTKGKHGSDEMKRPTSFNLLSFRLLKQGPSKACALGR